MSTDDALVSFKTEAWKDTGMVAGYAQRMHENRGTNRLKNEVEVDLCREHVTGDRILDVGIGTGRGSLPLVRAGKAVTGIDVSQAMLDQCRREAGDTPIDLLTGDLTKLPVPDASFDSIVSLNVVVHFPNWRDALADWARVVRPGGRLVFDVHSSDHLEAVGAVSGVAARDLLTPGQRDDPMQFMLRIGARDVAEAAGASGLCVRALIPYAAVLGGGNVNYWLRDSRLFGYLGDRALSWLAVDPKLLAFGAFLERDVAGNLSTSSTGRYMIVLEKTDDPAATAGVLARHAAIDRAFAAGDAKAIRSAVGPAADGWPAALAEHLRHAPNRALLAMALCAPAAALVRPLVEDVLGAEAARRAYDGHTRARIDEAALALIRTWRAEPETAEQLRFNGVDLGPTLEYDLMRDVLDAHFFAAQRSAS